MELTSLETTTPQWSVQDVISTFAPNHMTAVTGLDCQNADAAVLAQTLQSILGTTDPALLASQMQLMQAVTAGQSGNQVVLMPPSEALPWMMQQYPMMFLQSQVMPGWAQSLMQTTESPNSVTATSGDETTGQLQQPLYAQTVQLQFQDGLQLAAHHQQSPEFHANNSIAASPVLMTSASNSPAPVAIAFNQPSIHVVNGAVGMAPLMHGQGMASDQSIYNIPVGYTVARQETTKQELPKPPKKPLSPYMSFSKTIWSQVKAANPSMSVCEVGAAIGRLWRELNEPEKQHYNKAFTNDKVRYDQELQSYLKVTGLQASDLVKPRTKKNHPKPVSSANQLAKPALNPPVTVSHHPQASVAEAVMSGDPSIIANLARKLPHFSQVWTGQQQYIDPQVLAQLGQALFTNGDGTISLASIGLQPQMMNLNDGQVFSENPEVISHQAVVSAEQQNELDKVAINLTASVGDAMSWQWQQPVFVEGQRPLGQPNFAAETNEQRLTRTLIPKREKNDVKIVVGVGNDESLWHQMLPAVREAILEKELQQVRGALSEKTQEAQILMQQLEHANRIIEQLRLHRRTILTNNKDSTQQQQQAIVVVKAVNQMPNNINKMNTIK